MLAPLRCRHRNRVVSVKACPAEPVRRQRGRRGEAGQRDVPERVSAELIASSLEPAGICASIGADSLGFISLESLTEATTLPAQALCRACFDGDYPIPVAAAERGKHVLEEATGGAAARR